MVKMTGDKPRDLENWTHAYLKGNIGRHKPRELVIHFLCQVGNQNWANPIFFKFLPLHGNCFSSSQFMVTYITRQSWKEPAGLPNVLYQITLVMYKFMMYIILCKFLAEIWINCTCNINEINNILIMSSFSI